MNNPLYVVTETVEIGANSVEMISPAESLGGVFDDLCPALEALAKEESRADRRLYLAGFDHGSLTLETMLMGVYYDSEAKKHKFIDV